MNSHIVGCKTGEKNTDEKTFVGKISDLIIDELELKEFNEVVVDQILIHIIDAVKRKISDNFEKQKKLEFNSRNEKFTPLCSAFPSECCSEDGCPDAKECLKL